MIYLQLIIAPSLPLALGCFRMHERIEVESPANAKWLRYQDLRGVFVPEGIADIVSFSKGGKKGGRKREKEA
jgi:hypothetical protein